MGKPNIGAALGAMVGHMNDPNGLLLAANVACALSHMSPWDVRSLDSDLSLYFRSIGLRATRQHTLAQLMNMRRASMLVQRTIAPGSHPPENFDPIAHHQYQRQMRAAHAASRPTRPGMYLNGSYWAYSTKDERMRTRNAWQEARGLLEAGRRLAAGDFAGLKADWFGDGSRAHIIDVFDRTLDGMQVGCTGVSYAGPNALNNPLGLIEMTFAGGGTADQVAPLNDWGSAQKTLPGYICLQRKFFDPLHTGEKRTQPIDRRPVAPEMQVSRGGAIVHELTHVFGLTDDVRVTDQVFANIRLVRQAAHAAQAGYGVQLCLSMAEVQAAGAIRNADSYRLFCEDAALL